MKKQMTNLLAVFLMIPGVLLFECNVFAEENNDDKVEISRMNFFQIVELLNENKDKISRVTVSIRASAHDMKGLFSNANDITIDFKDASAEELVDIILNDSKFARKIRRGISSTPCGNDGMITFYTENAPGKPFVYISATVAGFIFNSYGPCFENIFYNPKLAEWLVENFEKAGLPGVAKKFKDNKNLYQDYKTTKKDDKQQ